MKHSKTFSPFAEAIRVQKYAHTKGDGTLETWEDTAYRVASNVLGAVSASKELIQETAELISNRLFIPGGRYLYSAGRPLHQCQNCLLLRAEDSREGWADLMHKSAMALMTGAGIGVDYSRVREEGALIKRTGGLATGPISLAKIINEAGRNIMQGGARRCLPAGSLVHTKAGLKRIEDVVPGVDEALTLKGYHPILALLDQGVQDLVQINTQCGEFRCTPNHRMAVLRTVDGEYDWVEAAKLQPQDRLLFAICAVEGGETSLPASNYDRPEKAYTAKEITIPALDTDMAWFLGYFQANGHSRIVHTSLGKRNSNVMIAIPKDAPQIVDKVKAQLSRFGVTPVVRDGDGECYTVRLASVPLALWIQENLKVTKQSIRVPDFILRGTQDVRAAFLAGVLDGDGSVSHRPISIVATIYKEFLYDLQALCASLGVTTRSGYIRPQKQAWKPLYHLNLVGESQEQRFVASAGKYLIYKGFEVVARKKPQCAYSIRPETVRAMAVGDRIGLHKNFKMDFPADTIERITGKVLPYTPVEVLSVVNVEQPAHTYDIEVADRNEFYCGGYLVHNSAIWGGLNWRHPDVFKWIELKDWSKEVRAIKARDFNFPATLDGTNISVLLDDAFFEAYRNSTDPRHSMAQSVYWAVIGRMLKTGEPGFSIDCGPKHEETLRNACTEICSAHDSDICNLGSINLARIESTAEMAHVTELATAFLLAGTVYSDVPYPKVKDVRDRNRRLGLGLMGIHEWLLRRGKKYGPDSELEEYLKMYSIGNRVTANHYSCQWNLSCPIAGRAIAPNGTIGIMAETSTSGEPLFAAAYKRRYLKGNSWAYQYVIDPIAKSLVDAGVNPDSIEDAYNIDPQRRVEFQVWLQKYVDHGISSTINLPSWGSETNNENTVQEFGNMLLPNLTGLRGITCFPNGARGGQPLTSVHYKTAVKNIGEVFYESGDICDVTKGGSCGS